MRYFVLGLASILLFSFAAQAEEATQMETFLGYTFTHVNPAKDVGGFGMNGGSGQFVFNANNWLGAVLDMGAVHNGSIHDINLDSTVADFLLGPRVSMRRWSRFTPYVQTLFGGAYATTSTPFWRSSGSGPSRSRPRRGARRAR